MKMQAVTENKLKKNNNQELHKVIGHWADTSATGIIVREYYQSSTKFIGIEHTYFE